MTLFAFDLDDTLLDRGKRIGPATAAALDRALRRGHEVVLATSRPMRTVRRFVAPALLTRCHAVTLNGAVLQLRGQAAQPLGGLAEVGRAIAEHPGLAAGADLTVELLGEAFATRRAAWTDAELAAAHSADRSMLLPLQALDWQAVSKVAVDGRGAALLHWVAPIEAWGGAVIPAMRGTFLNVVAPGTDKASALVRLMKALGRGGEWLVVFGDDLPDLGMLALADVAVAMGNAQDEVKRAADCVIGDCDADAIGDYLQAQGI